MPATVWVTCSRPGLDFRDAEKYGDVRYIADGRMHPASFAEAAEAASIVAEEWQDGDLILPVSSTTGSTILMFLLPALMERGIDRVRVLLHDARTRMYIARSLNLKGEYDGDMEF